MGSAQSHRTKRNQRKNQKECTNSPETTPPQSSPHENWKQPINETKKSFTTTQCVSKTVETKPIVPVQEKPTAQIQEKPKTNPQKEETTKITQEKQKEQINTIQNDFNLYQKDGEIQPEGLAQMIEDLGINDVGSIKALWVAWKLGAKDYKINENGFRKGLESVHVSSLKEFKNCIPEDPLNDNLTGKRLFNYAFECNVEYRQKLMEKEDSILLLHQFFGENNEMVNKFITFLSLDSTKPLNRDEWQNLYDFIKTIHLDFSNYDTTSDSAWPLLFDSFVSSFQN
ncbi:hypothetical protein KM1_024210 [Entamoeba histolytica HM-3:IMSS]|uniref:Defective in cullin neddylation protein n=2 Tax=Entamoeba histolytica TaxID=5759 RepID=M2SBF8_ENTHI|nr:Hypothetical protein EHI5A_022510 [Entamoeba histolytica KU27]EMS11934.1 hypothetical protein KM1_024210 [Entamoeba histolytica HM-3:IMSS]